jgi:hypothetical protein
LWVIRDRVEPLHGALLTNEQDVHLFERLAFLSRREVLRDSIFGRFEAHGPCWTGDERFPWSAG